MLKTINLNGRQVQYDLTRKKVKNINLRIKADRGIAVSANYDVSTREIEAFIKDNADRILRTLDRYAQTYHAPRAKQYVDGETIRILGKNLPLRVVQGNCNEVKCDDYSILLRVKDPNDFALKEKTVAKWMHSYCREVIDLLCRRMYPMFRPYGIPFPEIRLRKMVSCWGNCRSKRNVLTFNTMLIKTPIPCIEYVIVHEFTHFLQPNHSARFYSQMAAFMPDWQQRKTLLDTYHCHLE